MTQAVTATDRKITDADLTPTGYLVMEVLAARARMGERFWTMPTRYRAAFDHLHSLGQLWWESIGNKHARVWITDAGREYAMDASYETPQERQTSAMLIDLVTRVTASEQDYDRKARDAWDRFDVIHAVRNRATAEGLRIARDHHADVVAAYKTKESN